MQISSPFVKLSTLLLRRVEDEMPVPTGESGFLSTELIWDVKTMYTNPVLKIQNISLEKTVASV